MKVLHISVVDFGGAGTAALRLHSNLRASGLESKLLVARSRSADPHVAVSNNLALKIQSVAWKGVLRLWGERRYAFQNQGRTEAQTVERWCTREGFVPDVIVANSISNFMSIGQMKIRNESAPVPIVWHLLDMGPLTGGCHYAWDCRGYVSACGRCPAIRSIHQNDLSRRRLATKIALARDSNVVFVAASGWLRRRAAEATICQGARIEQILLAVDPEVFRPRPRQEARERLDLPPGARIVLVGALSMREARKGMGVLVEALLLLAERYGPQRKDVLILTAGKVSDMERLSRCGFPRRHLGLLAGDQELATAYQAADVFVSPSIEDAGPMMINEAIMSGTPVVAFDTGVAIDLVHTWRTGYRALLGSVEDLSRGIELMVSRDEATDRRMASECRVLGVEHCHPRVQVQAFTDLFMSLQSPQSGRNEGALGRSLGQRTA